MVEQLLVAVVGRLVAVVEVLVAEVVAEVHAWLVVGVVEQEVEICAVEADARGLKKRLAQNVPPDVVLDVEDIALVSDVVGVLPLAKCVELVSRLATILWSHPTKAEACRNAHL